ncbi:MAG: hypothetical protein ACOC4M_12060, partial [Promethearchaeia archaeon]
MFINNLKVIKEIPVEFENLVILESTLGLSEREDHNIVWTIEELEPDNTVYLKFSADIQVETKEAVNTGHVKITYDTSSSLTEDFSVEEFKAYTRNRFTIDQIERDEEPGVWDCNLTVINPSEFLIELYETDVHEADKLDEYLVGIDSETPIEIPAGDEWLSPVFLIESEEYPQLKKEISFQVAHELNSELKGEIEVGDVDLVLASIFGELIYEEEGKEVVKVPTFKESTINTILKIKNDGSAPLNEVSWQQRYFNDKFQPPSANEIVYLKDGEEVPITEEKVTLEDGVFRISFKDLKDSDQGMFEEDSEYEFQYPLHVVNPSRDATFDSEVVINGNTYPRSKELEYIPKAEETPSIEAVHIRRKYRVGKEVVPAGEFGEYKIILEIINRGNMPLENIFVKDKVPDSFERENFSMEPEIIDLDGEDILKWTIEELDVDSKVEIIYDIKGTGDYHPPGSGTILLNYTIFPLF